MLRSAFALVLAGIVLGMFTACSSESATPEAPEDAGARADAAGSSSGPAAEGSADAAEAGLTPTKRTSLEVTIAGVSRTLDRGQFVSERGDTGDVLYLEAHEGGDPGCPTESSPTPKRTLIVSGLPIGAPGQAFTKADGISAGLLDFEGDQLPATPVADATEATITIVSLDGTSSVEIEVDAKFEQGTAKGRIYAIYCESLSNRPKG